MHRREALQLLAAGAGIGSLDGLAIDEIMALGKQLHVRADAPEHARALRPHQNAIVTAAAERIIPAGETPGATDAGVTRFIDQMLAEWYEPAERDRVLVGLAELDERSRVLGAPDFVRLEEADQVAILNAIDEAAAAGSDHWFRTFKFLTVWGYFTSEIAMRETLGAFPLPMRYDGCAPYEPHAERP